MTVMLCEQCTEEQARTLCQTKQFIIEQKVDGVRGVIKNGKLYDRRGADITARFPEFTNIEKLEGMYDGELITATNEFGDIAGRMHLRDKFLLSLSVKQNPARFVLFDILQSEKDGATLAERKDCIRLRMEQGALPSWMMVLPWSEEFDEMWSKVQQNGWEGVVIKHKDAYYELRRSPNWRKVKAFQETEAVFTKYEVHPRGITIETPDGRRVVVNGAQAAEVKRKIDAGGAVCEIQFMKSALQGSDAWRFPSFRRVK
jgi:ATP-dependent DNA ligase